MFLQIVEKTRLVLLRFLRFATITFILIAVCFCIFCYFREQIMWPTIENPKALVKQCRILIDCYQKTNYNIDQSSGKLFREKLAKESWPIVVKKINPIEVWVSKEYVEILISTGGIDACYGYLIPYNTTVIFQGLDWRWVRTKGHYLKKSRYKDIYKWRGIE